MQSNLADGCCVGGGMVALWRVMKSCGHHYDIWVAYLEVYVVEQVLRLRQSPFLLHRYHSPTSLVWA